MNGAITPITATQTSLVTIAHGTIATHLHADSTITMASKPTRCAALAEADTTKSAKTLLLASLTHGATTAIGTRPTQDTAETSTTGISMPEACAALATEELAHG